MNKLELDKIKPLLRENRIKYAAVFGSYSKGKETSDSDIDILVKFKKPLSISLLGFVRLERQISEKLQKEVDLVTVDGISKYMKDDVMKEMKIFYGQK